MPFTPFHFGPGIFVKSVLSNTFSLRMFIFVNVVTDVEPLYFMLTNQNHLHRFTHSYLGATVVAIACILVGPFVITKLTEVWNGMFGDVCALNKQISKTAIITGAFIGTYSHVFLDSIMHRDIMPLNPIAQSNGLLHILTYEQLHLLCVGLGLAGLVIYCVSGKRKRDTLKN